MSVVFQDVYVKSSAHSIRYLLHDLFVTVMLVPATLLLMSCLPDCSFQMLLIYFFLLSERGTLMRGMEVPSRKCRGPHLVDVVFSFSKDTSSLLVPWMKPAFLQADLFPDLPGCARLIAPKID